VKPVITPAESARLDRASTVPAAALMEAAGFAVAIAARLGYGDSVAVLTGKGNNGGDGWVAAFHLARRGAKVIVHEFARPSPGSLADSMRSRALDAGIRVLAINALWEPSLIIDAVFGVGFTGQLPAAIVPWTESGVPVLAVDLPSGVEGGTGGVDGAAFAAQRTVTFHALKPAHLVGPGADYCGLVTVVDIGLTGERPLWLFAEMSDAPIRGRDRHAHKWSVGSVAVVGGSAGMSGAPVLAARAAMAAGAGAVTVVGPGAATGAIPPELLSQTVGGGDHFAGGDEDAVLELATRFDVLVLGPGAGSSSDATLADIAARWPGPIVVDADGLRAVANDSRIAERRAPTVLTPHAGELETLRSHPGESAPDIARRYRAVLVEKGNPSFVHWEETWVVTTGGPELATIGTGDVLAGIIGAFLAVGQSPAVAARSAVYWHGVAGAKLRSVRTLTASLLVDAVARTLAAVPTGATE